MSAKLIESLGALHTAMQERESTTSAIWEPDSLGERRAKLVLDPLRSAQLIAILRSAPQPGETYLDAANRKERELRTVFSTLRSVEALALRTHLDIGSASDELVVELGRLIPERRARLVAYLDLVRRHAAGARSAAW